MTCQLALASAGRFISLETKGGKQLSGELVAIYDHSKWWWNSSDSKTYAVFESSKSATDCFTFINDSQINSLKIIEQVNFKKSYRDFLIENKLLIEKAPTREWQYIITGNGDYHDFEDGFGNFAWDIVHVDKFLKTFKNQGLVNSDYYSFGKKVYSPVSGRVVEVEALGVDNIPGDYPNGAINNFVGIKMKGNFHFYILHFKKDSIGKNISVGSKIKSGDFLGLLGNSGVTLEPHVHMTMFWWDESAKRFWSIPSFFKAISVRSESNSTPETQLNYSPLKGSFIL
ncbi:hypothetical protein A9Q84_10885 [Halobacteriovorax marinus]|uniref:M23ase beta-sheet core domain-containing protein n=1 Tax=Halobacteriovorax marinus TaxID=97084 RepID=A0A1Y5F7T2_9BACT|nr:hypothetical protein A9Q84_10885 [Halobacteriovorax marinus]